MKTWTAIFNFIAIFIIIILLPCYYNFSKAMDKEFDQMRLDMAVDKATKAMLISTLQLDDISLDHSDMKNGGEMSVNLAPGEALEMFDIVMCFNYGMQPTPENMNKIENSICAMVVCDSFGYYIAELVEDDLTPNNDVLGMDYVLRWSMRVPYTDVKYTNNDPKDGVESTITFSYSHYPIIEIDKKGKSSLEMKTLAESHIERDYLVELINKQLTKAIRAEINRKNALMTEYTFRLPERETTKLGVNPIDGPSVLVMLNNATYASNYPINAVNVGGYKVRQRQYIVCFEKYGQKWYCYANQLPEADQPLVQDFVSTMKDACDLGYTPYYPYLMKNKFDK